jgi:hypothetical protein
VGQGAPQRADPARAHAPDRQVRAAASAAADRDPATAGHPAALDRAHERPGAVPAPADDELRAHPVPSLDDGSGDRVQRRDLLVQDRGRVLSRVGGEDLEVMVSVGDLPGVDGHVDAVQWLAGLHAIEDESAGTAALRDAVAAVGIGCALVDGGAVDLHRHGVDPGPVARVGAGRAGLVGVGRREQQPRHAVGVVVEQRSGEAAAGGQRSVRELDQRGVDRDLRIEPVAGRAGQGSTRVMAQRHRVDVGAAGMPDAERGRLAEVGPARGIERAVRKDIGGVVAVLGRGHPCLPRRGGDGAVDRPARDRLARRRGEDPLGALADVPEPRLDGGQRAALRARVGVAAPARLVPVEPPTRPPVGRRRLPVGLRARRQRPRARVRDRRDQRARHGHQDDGYLLAARALVHSALCTRLAAW